jgi:hypothetical protein
MFACVEGTGGKRGCWGSGKGLKNRAVDFELVIGKGRSVRELMGWVRNVVLIKCIFGSGKPKGGRDFGWEGTWAR